MPHISKLRKVGGSVMVAIPPALLEVLNMTSASSVSLSVSGETLVITPENERPVYKLSDLLAQCDFTQPDEPDASGWLSSPPVGRELI